MESGRVLALGGRCLFVDERGPAAKPALLFVPGGPGMSCHEFMHWQGDALAARGIRVIGTDPRGVLRSDALGADETLTEHDLVEDIERIRTALGIEQWVVLGHSFGGRIALRYACRFPERSAGVIFENPLWSFRDTERHRLPALADLLDEEGDHEAAARCRALRAEVDSFVDWGPMGEFLDRTWQRADVHDPAALEAMLRVRDAASFEDGMAERAGTHERRMLDNPEFVRSLLPLLDELQVPSLLVHGRYDLVVPPTGLEAYARSGPAGRTVHFDRSAHFCHLEEAERYTEVVSRFVLER